ncbi:MAG: tetratricopeptide repeat protein, partial [Thermodesulfobacteriota bacterium]
IVLPLFLALYDYARKRDIKLLRIKDYIPYIVIAVAYLILRSLVLKGGGGGGASRELYFDSTFLQLLNIFPLLIGYFIKLILPFGLSPSYIFSPVASLFEAKAIVSIIISIILVLFLWKNRKAKPLLWLLAALVVVPILPTFYQLFYDPDIYYVSMPSDRYLYMPSVGFALLAGMLLFYLSKRFFAHKTGAPLLIIFLIVALIYTLGPIQRSKMWRDDMTLWTQSRAQNPDNFFPHYMLAELYVDRGLTREALKEMEAVVRLRPGFASGHHRLGLLYYSMGVTGKALGEFNQVIKTNPESRDAHYNIGVINLEHGFTADAIIEFKAALNASVTIEEKVKVENYLAGAYITAGDYEKAKAEIARTLKLDPSNATALALRARIKELKE